MIQRLDASSNVGKLEQSTVERFREALHGELVAPQDVGYDEARRVWNRQIDKRPALVARCASAADVVRSVQFARDNDLVVAVRGGAHSISGKSVCDGGLVIDLSLMKGIQVDSARRTASAQAGLQLGEFDRATQAFGLATPLGIVSDTGIAGLTLGGGLGWLNGAHGLACDNLLSAQVVTADGRLLTASPVENEDLFWGLRGGGGNFGVVTMFEYQLHPVGPILGGMLVYPVSRAKEVLARYGEFSHDGPDELSTMAGLLTAPDGNLVVGVVACYAGAIAAGERALEPLRRLDAIVADMVKPMTYTEMQSILDGAFPAGNRHYWKSSFLRDLDVNAVETLVERAIAKPSAASLIGLQHMHGATSRIPPAATAFAHRQDQYDCLILAQWSDPGVADDHIEWARTSWQRLEPFLERSVYVNNLGDEGDDRVRSAYGGNFERLAAVKQAYDPENFFRHNQNIQPRH
jgi:FAD/FMN-containing dehydrogenase